MVQGSIPVYYLVFAFLKLLIQSKFNLFSNIPFFYVCIIIFYFRSGVGDDFMALSLSIPCNKIGVTAINKTGPPSPN